MSMMSTYLVEVDIDISHQAVEEIQTHRLAAAALIFASASLAS